MQCCTNSVEMNGLSIISKTSVFRKKNEDHTFIVHYAKGYDVQFILNWLVGRGLKPNIISVGNKVLSLEVKFDYNIRFIDSLSFTLCALRDFPKTFELTELVIRDYNKDPVSITYGPSQYQLPTIM